MVPPSDLDGKIITDQVNQVTQWATVMKGTHYSGVAFDQGHYNLPYEFFSEFDLVLVALRHELIEVGLKIKKQSTARVIVILDGEMDYFTTLLLGELQVQYIELINLADAVAVLHEYDIPIIKTLTPKPVGLAGCPFPLKRVREELCPKVHKNQVIELGSAMGIVMNRNGLVNLAALSEIGLPGATDNQSLEEIEYVRQMRKYIPIPPIHFRNKGSDFWQDRVTRWEQFISRINYSIMGLHLDYRQVWGRFALDCAVVRMPCIAADNFQTQKILFPRLCLKNYLDIDHAVKLAKELLKNNSFYEEVMAYAESQLSFFDNEAAKKRLLDLLN
jgi:hypothetical protein